MLRFEAIVHNTKALHTVRVLERFPEIVSRLEEMLGRFTTMLDCVDVAFLLSTLLDELRLASRLGEARVGGIDTNKPRMCAVLTAIVALVPSPDGFTIGELATTVRAQTRPT